MKCHNLIVISIVLIISMSIFCQGEPISKKGKGRKAFGAGLLTGALAGAVVGNVLTRKAQSSNSESNKHITTIQNGAILANGCFEQTVRESDPRNSRKFVETVNLICPSIVPVSVLTPVHTPITSPIPTAHTVPINLSSSILVTPNLPETNEQRPNETILQVSEPAIQIPKVDTASSMLGNFENISQISHQNQPQIMPQATIQINPEINSNVVPQQIATQTVIAHATQPTIQIPQVDAANSVPVNSENIPHIFHQNQHLIMPQTTIQTNPQMHAHAIPQTIATQTTFSQAPKVYVISKKTEYYNKKSAAINFIPKNYFLMLLSIILLIFV